MDDKTYRDTVSKKSIKKRKGFLYAIVIFVICLCVIFVLGINYYKKIESEAWIWSMSGMVSQTYRYTIENGEVFDKGPAFYPLIKVDMTNVDSMLLKIHDTKKVKVVCRDKRINSINTVKRIINISKKYSKENFLIVDKSCD